jgi:hypothetical protein
MMFEIQVLGWDRHKHFIFEEYDVGNTVLCLCVDRKKRLSGYT